MKTDRIEDYLLNKLSAEESSKFAGEVSSDPLLKQEVDFHSDIIDALKEHRKNELKRRLSQVDITKPVSIGQKLAIAAATLLVSGSMGYFGYQWMNSGIENPDLAKETVEVVSPEKSEEKALTVKAVEENQGNTQEEITSPTEDEIVSNNPGVVPTEVETPQDELASPQFTEPTFEMEVSDEMELGSGNDDELRTPGTVKADRSFDNTSATFVNSSKFSYYYDGEKLYLEIPMEGNVDKPLVIDLDTGNEVYLKYGDQFYKIDKTTTKREPLKKHLVTDQELIKKLNQQSK